jgi:hypothetical protein
MGTYVCVYMGKRRRGCFSGMKLIINLDRTDLAKEPSSRSWEAQLLSWVETGGTVDKYLHRYLDICTNYLLVEYSTVHTYIHVDYIILGNVY